MEQVIIKLMEDIKNKATKVADFRKFILATFLTLNIFILFAQHPCFEVRLRPKDNINLNILGDASILSVNYERLLFISRYTFLSGSLGIGYNEIVDFRFWRWKEGPDNKEYMTIPFHLTGNIGMRSAFFEIGMGGTIITTDVKQKYRLYPIYGFRLQPLRSNNVSLRIFGSYPYNVHQEEYGVFVPFGVSIGYSF